MSAGRQLERCQVPESQARRCGAAHPSYERVKISGPTVEPRTPDEELTDLYKGHGYAPRFVEGDDPKKCISHSLKLWINAMRRSSKSRRKHGRVV